MRRSSTEPCGRQVLRVRSCVAGSDAERALRAGDLLLAVDGRPVTSCAAVQRLVEAAGSEPGAQASPTRSPGRYLLCGWVMLGGDCDWSLVRSGECCIRLPSAESPSACTVVLVTCRIRALRVCR